MEVNFARCQLMKSIAVVCRDIGWDHITLSALHVLIDLMTARIKDTIRIASGYSSNAGRDVLGLAATCNALIAMGEDMVGLREFCMYMPRVESQHSQLNPCIRRVEVGHINPGSGYVEPGFIEVHHWLQQLKKLRSKLRESELRRSPRIQERYKDVNGTNDDGIFKKPTAPAPRARKAAHQPH